MLTGRYGLTPRASAVAAAMTSTKRDSRKTGSAPATIRPRGQHDIVNTHETRFVAVRLWHAASVRRHRDGEVVAPQCVLCRLRHYAGPPLRPRPVSLHEGRVRKA